MTTICVLPSRSGISNIRHFYKDILPKAQVCIRKIERDVLGTWVSSYYDSQWVVHRILDVHTQLLVHLCKLTYRRLYPCSFHDLVDYDTYLDRLMDDVELDMCDVETFIKLKEIQKHFEDMESLYVPDLYALLVDPFATAGYDMSACTATGIHWNADTNHLTVTFD